MYSYATAQAYSGIQMPSNVFSGFPSYGIGPPVSNGFLPYGGQGFSPYCDVPLDFGNLYQSRHYQQITYLPEPPAQMQVIRKRMPDPPPDVIERVVVVPQPKSYVYQVVEVPTKPPPVIQDRYVQGPANPVLCGGTLSVQVPSQTNLAYSNADGRVGIPAANYSSSSPVAFGDGVSYGGGVA
ncbi:unnamed protein product [Didymodactylos carnosus]|uniref:Uncharacterized protein n=1 Tax=Didymodactylos carnosus TaxID=1234261 RepID=A0A8S2IQH5_9BILA|nr:unnamed protein product [Didymodactylos carnosus]CAF3770377.1 unnamed protein product [Didymodactylos carnosus]